MISLLYCGNDRVFRGLLISLLSVASHTQEALDVHLLTMDLTDKIPRSGRLRKNKAPFWRKFSAKSIRKAVSPDMTSANCFYPK